MIFGMAWAMEMARRRLSIWNWHGGCFFVCGELAFMIWVIPSTAAIIAFIVLSNFRVAACFTSHNYLFGLEQAPFSVMELAKDIAERFFSSHRWRGGVNIRTVDIL